MKLLQKIKSLEAFQEITKIGGQIFLVGGAVRDFYLHKESKDIDIIIRCVESPLLVTHLKKYGRVDLVGQTFGVIKFTPFDGWYGEPIDIALPRKDILEDKSRGHHGIRAEFDHMLSIEDDLHRRDCTCNAIAISWNGDIIDPHNGIEDIRHGIIRAVSSQSFLEDPLRQLRAIQFAARFNFTIEAQTWNMVCDGVQDLLTISGERIHEELEKIYTKGNIQYGIRLLNESKIISTLFGYHVIDNYDIQTRGDFYRVVCENSEKYRTVLKGEILIEKEIKALEKCLSYQTPSIINTTTLSTKRILFFDALQISSSILRSKQIPFVIKCIQEEFVLGLYPKSYKELAVGGDDLLALGYSGKQLGDVLKELLYDVLSDRQPNVKNILLATVQPLS